MMMSNFTEAKPVNYMFKNNQKGKNDSEAETEMVWAVNNDIMFPR